LVALNSQGRHEVAAAGALTGIEPRNLAGRGARGHPGRGVRKRAAYEKFLANKPKSTPGRKPQTSAESKFRNLSEATKYDGKSEKDAAYRAYAIAILEYVGPLRDGALDSFYTACRKDYGSVLGLDADTEAEGDAASFSRDSATLSALETATLLRVPLTARVQFALDAVRLACSANGRAVYTSDVLLALLEMSGGRVGNCFNEISTGLARRVHDWLVQEFGHITPGTGHPFQAFVWPERPEIRRAQSLALEDEGVVTDMHLLVAIMEGDSTTKKSLRELLGPDFHRLLIIARRSSHDGLPALKTPRGKTGLLD
jgi:hypothetical protein